jgi:transcriptional regulator with XRE-family HTH domain
MGRPIERWHATTYARAIGAVFTELRLKKRGLSYKEAAEKMGIDDSYLQRLEAGKANPTMDILRAVAGFYKIRLSRIMALAEARYASAKRKRTKKS